jgi:sugar phosphate isomerase/epimerase
MNSLMSINFKFMGLSPKELIELVLESKYCKGVELCIDNDSPIEEKYLDELIYEIKRNNLILQIHGDSRLPIDEQIKYMKELENYSDILGYPINVTLHSIFDEDKEKSINLTIEYFHELLNNVDNNKVIICLENLNDFGPIDRLEKEIIEPIILNDDRLYMTYDIGHEIVDWGNVTDVNGYLLSEIRNIHIHTYSEEGVDHQPIYRDSLHWNDVLKGILFLVNSNYNYNIVYEYDLYECHGDNLKDKVRDYLKSIDLVSERYGK